MPSAPATCMDEFEEATAVVSPSDDRFFQSLDTPDLGETVLNVSEAFCCLAPRLGEDGIDASDDIRSSSSASSFSEWLPCSLTLTEQVVALSRKTPSEAPSVGSGISTKASKSDEEVLCMVPLARIVDVASSVCVFGNMLDQERGNRSGNP